MDMEKKKQIIHGVVIPPGYEKLSVFRDPTDPEIKDKVRWLANSVAFIFDPENLEYLDFLQVCREDSLKLRKALKVELAKRGAKIWLEGGRLPQAKKDFCKMNFLIRPPFFESYDTSINPEKRMQPDDNSDNFILHFDSDHTLQEVRWWAGHGKRNLMRVLVNEDLKKEVDFFKQNYGQWEAIAKKMAEILENCLRIYNQIEY